MPLLVMLMCRCHDCGRQQMVAPKLDPACGACGGDLGVDVRYHPEHAMAVDFGGPATAYFTPEEVSKRELAETRAGVPPPAAPFTKLTVVVGKKNGVR